MPTFTPRFLPFVTNSRFFNGMRRAVLLQIAQRPGTGSRCRFTAEELRGTRRMPVAGFGKHLIFYQARESEIVILRVVHGARDLESLFSEGASEDRVK